MMFRASSERALCGTLTLGIGWREASAGGAEMLRVVLSAGDLARVRIRANGPVAEALLSLTVLHGPRDLLFGGWRQAVLRGQPQWIRPLTEVMGSCCTLD